MTTQIYDKLYHLDSKGKMRVWWVERNGPSYAVTSGLETGKWVTTGAIIAEAKNVGRSNATSPELQADSEIESMYRKKLEQKYYKTPEEAKAATTRTKYFAPMLAIKWKEMKKPFVSGFVQPKLDGIRGITTQGQINSRRGKAIPTCPHIPKILAPLFIEFPHLILDGELYNHKYHDNFNEIGSLINSKKPDQENIDLCAKEVEYHIYDVPSHIGPFSERIKYIIQVLIPAFNKLVKSPMIKFVETFPVTGEEEVQKYFATFTQQNYEGLMVRLDTSYQNKRSENLIKYKDFFDAEYRIKEILEGSGSWAGAAKSVICEDGSETFDASIKGSMEQNRILLADRDKYKWATIRYPNLTPRGVPRFGVAVAFYDKKGRQN